MPGTWLIPAFEETLTIAPPPQGAHSRNDGPHSQNNPKLVYPVVEVPERVVGFHQAAWPVDPRIVDPDVDPAEVILGRGDEVAPTCRIGDIVPHEKRVPREGVHQRRVGSIDIGEHDLCALRCEQLRRRGALPPARSGDDCDLACETRPHDASLPS
jgi:hypothetical protein